MSVFENVLYLTVRVCACACVLVSVVFENLCCI